jgi:hypothetical protein
MCNIVEPSEPEKMITYEKKQYIRKCNDLFFKSEACRTYPLYFSPDGSLPPSIKSSYFATKPYISKNGQLKKTVLNLSSNDTIEKEVLHTNECKRNGIGRSAIQ